MGRDPPPPRRGRSLARKVPLEFGLVSDDDDDLLELPDMDIMRMDMDMDMDIEL